MRSTTAAMILAFVSAIAVQAAPTSITAPHLQPRSQSDLEADVAAADALDTRTFDYDDEEEDDRSPVKRWIQDLVERAVTPGEKFSEEEARGDDNLAKRTQEDLEREVAEADALDTREFKYDEEEDEEEGDDNLAKRTQEDLEREVAEADALDTREFEYDEEEEDDRSPVKRWIQDFVERAVVPGEKFTES